jgi:putative protease
MRLFDFWKRLFGNKKRKGKTKKITRKTKKKFSQKKIRKTKKHIQKKSKRKTKKTFQKKTTLKRKIKKKPSKKSISRIKKSSLRRKLASQPKEKEVEIGVITHYFGRISVGVIKLKKPLKLGDKIHIKGVNTDFTQVVESMQINHKDVEVALAKKEVGIKVIQRVHENNRVYKVLKD